MQSYLESTRSPWYSLVFILPLWLLYELLGAVLNLGQDRTILNGADAVLMQSLSLLGVHGRLAAEVCLAVVAFAWVYRTDKTHRSRPLKPAWLLGMLVESTVYACLLGGIVARLVRLFVPGFVLGLNAGVAALNVGMQFMTSLGAGVFEELLFRVLIMGGLTWAGVHWLRLNPSVSLGIGALVSSLLFSAFHYIGSMADNFSLASFAFRFFAGLVLATIYRVRGFGIAACTHALYDVLVLLQGLA